MRLLVCGGRDWFDRATFDRILDKIATIIRIAVVIEGGARGADQMAAQWAVIHDIEVETYEADWSALGKTAGLTRNRQMLHKGKPDLVIAFPTIESRGTWHMVGIARAKGVPVWIMPADEPKIDALGEGVFV